MIGILPRADQLGAYFDKPPVPRPALIQQSTVKLSRAWSDCVICGCDLDTCECDPNDYAAALLAKLNGVRP